MYDALRRTAAWRRLRRTRAVRELLHLRGLAIDPEYRGAEKSANADFERFRGEQGGTGLRAKLPRAGKRKTALLVHQYLPFAPIEMLLVKALQMAGFDCTPVNRRRHYSYLRYDWLAGNDAGHMLEDFDTAGDPQWVAQEMPKLRTTRDWLDVRYRGVRVGQFVLATVLRYKRAGRLNFNDPDTRSALAHQLNTSVRWVIGASRLIDYVKPDLLLCTDKGYSGFGEFFDLAVSRGVDCITWHTGYKSNRLVFKRYNARNERDHPLCPSAASWDRVRQAPWQHSLGDTIRQEFLGAYRNQDWFSGAGTQFGKQIVAKDALLNQMHLSPHKKIAVIFPHILWDGSFFFGEDLFENYTEWFVETIKAACANDRLQWVVKLHPAHVVKDKRDGYSGKPAELASLEGVIDSLPPHITLLPPEAPISTYSIFQIADYVVTVRGTVGIEAALLGIPVVTGGTGRYDRRGFTVDSATREEYLARLAILERQPPLSQDQIELAERYAYYTFLCRPLQLSCASLEYARDGKATPIVTVLCQTPAQWQNSPDMQSLAAWFQEGLTEDFIGAPLPSGEGHENSLAEISEQVATA
jgi:hypothetical protein